MLALAVAPLLAAAPEARAELLISNLNIGTATTATSRLDSGQDVGQGFTTGTNAGGYTLESIELFFYHDISAGDIGDLTVTLRSESSGNPGTTLDTLTNPASIAGETNSNNITAADAATFTAPSGTVLAAETTYFVVLEFGGSTGKDLYGTSSGDEESGGAAGWSIADDSKVGITTWSTANNSFYIRVNGAERAANNPATGAPTISGTAQVESTLTASTTGIMDDDGLTSPTYSYQWIRVDGGDTDISGATSSTYTPVDADAGKKVKVKVSFTDDDGNAEELTSAAYPATGTIVGRPTVVSVAVTSTPTAETDTYGVGEKIQFTVTFSEAVAVSTDRPHFEFSLDGTNTDAAYEGGSGTTALTFAYTVQATDEDDDGIWIGDETRTVKFDSGEYIRSVATSLDADLDHSGPGTQSGHKVDGSLTPPSSNNPATGAPTISGTAQVESTLTASTTGIMDDDGLTSPTYSYQWIRVDGGDADISGATSSTYTPVDADAGKKVKVKVSFTDDDGNAEELTSAAYPATGTIVGRPTVASVAVTSTPTAETDTYGVGEKIQFTVTFSEAVAVSTDRPHFEFSLDGTNTDAAYEGGSGTTALTFAYTVQATDEDDDGIWIGDETRTVKFDSGEYIRSVATSLDADLDHSVPGTQSGHKVDGSLTPPGSNTPATGAPTISGTAQEGSTLTASTSAISDTDGLTSVSYSYQWVREDADGTNPVDIAGATSSTYPVVAADVGKKLKVKVSFTDDDGNAEGPLTSTATDTVIAVAATTVTIAAAMSEYTHKLSSVTWNLTRAGTASELAGALTVSLTMSQSQSFMTASELAKARTATFAATAATATLTIPHTEIQGGATTEGTLTATVAAGTGYELGTPNAASTTMKVGSPAVTVSFNKEAFQAPEDSIKGGDVPITAVLAQGLPVPNVSLFVTFATEDDTAVAPGDYAALSETLEIAPSDWAGRRAVLAFLDQTVTIVDDGLVEPNESLNLLLGRTAGLPTGAVEVVMSDGSACPVVGGQAGCLATLTILEDIFDTLPMLSKSAVNGATLTLTYDKAMDEDSTPATGAFTVLANGSTVEVTGVTVAGDRVRLTLASPVLPGQTVTMSYLLPGSGPIQDEAGNKAGALSARAVDNRTTYGVQGDLRLEDGPNASEGRLEVFYQGQWGTVCDDRFTSWARPRGGGPAEPNRASAVACRIMGYEGGEYVSGHDYWSRASLEDKPIWLDDVRCLAGDPSHNAGDGDSPVSLFDCYHAGRARHNCAHREDVAVRCTGAVTEPADVRGPGAPTALVESGSRGIVLIFEEALADAANRLPPRDAFELTVDGVVTPIIASVTGPSVDGLAADRIRLVLQRALPAGDRIWVYYTDPSDSDDTAAIQDETGNDTESFFVAASRSGQPGQASEGAGVAAEFRDLPERHDGAAAFSFELAFGEDVAVTAEALRTAALQVTGATIASATKLSTGDNRRWRITLTPSSRAAVTVALPALSDCSAAGAVCTADGRGLAEALGAEVAGPETPTRVLSAEVTSGPGENGTWDAGETVTAEVRFSATVNVLGPPGAAPTLGILLDGTRREAMYQGGSGTRTLRFSHPVGAADAGARRAQVAANGLSLNGTVLGDERGLEAETGFSNAPLVTGVELVADESEDGSWTPGETVEVRLTFSEAVTVADGTPTVGIAIDGAASTLDYASGSGSATLVFSKSVTGSDGTLTAIAVTADSLALNGATIVSVASGVAAGLAHDGTTPAPGTGATGLTAEFLDLPESHGGALFTFRLRFSEEFLLSWKTLKGYGDTPSAFQFANGSMTGISRATQGENREWNVTVTPSGSGDVSITLPATTDCTASNAICTADDRALSAAVTARVPQTAPVQSQVQVTPLTVAFEVSPPGEHDGASEFTFHIAFSEDLDGYSWRTLRDTSLRVQQGTSRLTPYVRRLVQGSNRRWEVTVTPSSKGDVTIGIGPGPACTDAAAMCTSGGTAVSNAIAATVLGPPGLSVADARVTEAAGATLDFAVTLSRAAAATVTVDYATSDGTATEGTDYTAASGTLSFAPGELTKTVSVAVTSDDHDEDEETFTLTLSNASGNHAWLSDATATGTIENTGAMPRAWLGRFGRTVAGHVLDAVSERMEAPRAAGLSVALGGRALPGLGRSGDAAASLTDAETREVEGRAQALSDWLNGETGGNGDAARGIGSRTVTGRELALGSAFSLTGETSDGATAGFWGRAAVSGFDGREGELTLDGEVATGLLGADYGHGRWLMGLIASHSRGEGGYRGVGEGTVSSTLTGVHPWARYAVSERLSVWGAAGYGAGTLTLEPEGENQAPMQADLSLALAAAGGRGELVEAPGDAGGPALALVSDAMLVRTESESSKGAGGNLAGAEADVTRLRLAFDGSWRFVLAGDAALTPSLELGMRHDGGDAETGFGVDVGGGLAFAAPKRGLAFDVSARTLVAHEASGFRERGVTAALSFDPLPSTDRGLTMSLRQTLGAASTGGAHALMGRETLAGLGADDDGDARRLELTAGYGVAMFGGRFTGTPELGLGLSDAGRDYRLGWRLGLGSGGATSFEFGLEATRRESENDDEAEHAVGFRIRAAW